MIFNLNITTETNNWKCKVMDNKVVEIAAPNEEKYIREFLDSIYQGVKDLVLAYDNAAGDVKFLMILSKNISFQELKLKITASKLMKEILMISHLLTRLSNTAKVEKYQKDKVMITQLVVCWSLLILKKTGD